MREMGVPSTGRLDRRVTQRLVGVWSVNQTRAGLSDSLHGGVLFIGIGSINELSRRESVSDSAYPRIGSLGVRGKQ